MSKKGPIGGGQLFGGWVGFSNLGGGGVRRERGRERGKREGKREGEGEKKGEGEGGRGPL